MKQISNEHLKFLEEAKQIFIDEPFRETHRNDDETLIALRYGEDRDCVWIYELGESVAFFAQQIEPMPIEKKLKQEEI